MIRTAGLSVVIVMGVLWSVPRADAQVYVRAPFVRVETGNGVYVRAPFVRLWIPNGPPPAYLIPPPASTTVVPAPTPPSVMIRIPNPPAVLYEPSLPQQPAPGVVPPPPPQPLQGRSPTLAEFARSFQARAGQYNVTIVNPATGQPVQVQFSLPEGTPRRVIVENDEIEFRYSIRQFVRLEFTANGVIVTSR